MAIVSLHEGHVTVNRTVKERGYLLRLKCYLQNYNLKGLTRQQQAQQFTINVERILNGLQHPGYHRVDEGVNGDGTYSLWLVPVTKSAMAAYVREFDNAEEGMNDLEAGIRLIDNDQVRSDAMSNFIALLIEKEDKETAEGTEE